MPREMEIKTRMLVVVLFVFIKEVSECRDTFCPHPVSRSRQGCNACLQPPDVSFIFAGIRGATAGRDPRGTEVPG